MTRSDGVAIKTVNVTLDNDISNVDTKRIRHYFGNRRARIYVQPVNIMDL